MKNQEVFDTVARHLLTQKEPSQDKDSGGMMRCMYRGPRGLKCAVGALIPDECYFESLESKAVMHSEVLRVIRSLGMYRAAPLLADLQRLHDDREPSQWREGLRNIARGYRLSPAVLEEFAA